MENHALDAAARAAEGERVMKPSTIMLLPAWAVTYAAWNYLNINYWPEYWWLRAAALVATLLGLLFLFVIAAVLLDNAQENQRAKSPPST